MLLNIVYMVAGLALLVWSADRFVDGSAITARHLNIPPLLIGMVVVGFGTSAPEMLVSGLSAWNGNPGIALGNAYGSNICNIGLILGTTALIKPITVPPGVLKKDLTFLVLVTLMTIFLFRDQFLSRPEALFMMAAFLVFLTWRFFEQKRVAARYAAETGVVNAAPPDVPLKKALITLLMGLVILIASSKLLVSSAVAIARMAGISDLIIGLSVIAFGTSVPELASSIAAARKQEHDIVLGNIIGSNLFNTLMVIGIAGSIHPMQTDPHILSRDLPVVFGLTMSLFPMGYAFKNKTGRISRIEGGGLLVAYLAYAAWLSVLLIKP